MDRWLKLAVLAAWLCASPLPAAPSGSAAEPKLPPKPSEVRRGEALRKPGPLVLDDKPEVLVPKQPRTEADRDRLEAMARFSAARLREQRQDYAGALRLYERAFRCDPGSATIARSIIPLAARLQRHAEAVRYALKVVELEAADPDLLRRLGAYLVETGEYDHALVLYEKAAAVRKDRPAGMDVVLWMEMGRLYHLLEKYDQAAQRFVQVLEALEHPKDFGIDEQIRKVLLSEPAPTYNIIGEAFLLAGQPEKAVAAFRKANQAAANAGLLAYNLARVDARAGNPEKALQRLDAYFRTRQASEGLAPYRLLADVLKALHKENELIRRVERLAAVDAENVPLGYFLAEKYREAGQLDKAAPLYQSLAAKAPTTAGYRNLVGIYAKTGRYEPLLAILGDAVAKTGSLESLTEKGKLLGEDARLVRAVLDLARKRIKQDPKTVGYEQRLAVALLALAGRQWDAAGEFFDLAIRATPDRAGELMLSWGLELVLKEQYDRAIPVLRRGAGLSPVARLGGKSSSDPVAVFYFYLAGALEMTGKTDEALAAARKAAEMAVTRDAATVAKAVKRPPAKKEAPRYFSRIAWILYHAKRSDEAAKIYREVVEKFGNDYSVNEVRQVVRDAKLILSNLAVLKGNMPQAIEWLEQVLDEFPDDPGASNDLGYLWADQGKNLQRAYAMIQKAVEQEPDNAAYRDSLGWILFRLGRLPEALAELEKAAAKEPDPAVFDHLGDAYHKAGKADRAKHAWRRAAEAYRKAGDPGKARQVEQKAAA